MASEWQITKETEDLPVLNNPILIEGLPGIGNVGKTAVDFLVEELRAKKLFSFFSHKFPHSVFVDEDNLVEMPKIEVYYKKFPNLKGVKKKDLLLLVGDIQPIDEESCYNFCEEILNISKTFSCSEVIATGGIGLQDFTGHPKVYCTSNDKELYSEYTKKGMGVQKNIFGVVGPILGVSGVLLGLGKMRNVKAVALLAETLDSPIYLGIKGAKEILKVIDKRFSYGIKIEKIDNEIAELEKEIMKKTQEWVSELAKGAANNSAGGKAKDKETNYIG